MNKAGIVGIMLGNDDDTVKKAIDGLKQTELDNLQKFEERNPEINLLGVLNIELEVEDFPPLITNIDTTSKAG